MNRSETRDARRHFVPSGPLGLLIAVLVAPLLGCASIDVSTEVAPGSDFSRYRSYALLPRNDDPEAVVVRRIESELKQALAARELQPADPDEADLLVAFRESGRSRERLREAGDPDTNYTILENYVEGTLEIVMIDRASTERVWRGVGTTDIPKARDIPGAAARAVDAILRDFPPGRAAARQSR